MCRVRGALRDEEGMLRLYTFNYAEVSSLAVDPVEKKPLGRFCPGTLILSAGLYGCNMKCLFCQNYHIAHEDPETLFMTPQDMLEKVRQHRESIGLAFTYNERIIQELICTMIESRPLLGSEKTARNSSAKTSAVSASFAIGKSSV